ncbi:MAG TPA: N-acetylmuramoyl-L-alanine amidase [Bacteroidota bacterium]|nr:N-acetylmuramoyl-L-alanine amidase [Bacteroidota bacterium]
MSSLRLSPVILYLFALLLLGCGKAFSLPSTDSLFLHIVEPETDTTITIASHQRISACTVPSGKAFINGKEVKVYSSGAFCGLVSVPVGTSTLRLVARAANGDSVVKEFLLQRPEPPKTSPRDPLVIDTVMMEPSQDLWLGKNDILEVKFKGSPGYRASFDIDGVESGIPMTELPPGKSGGLEGVYIGRYAVKEDDEARNVQIRFRLKKSFFSSEKAYSKGRVSILPKELPQVAEIVGKRAYLNAGVGNDRLGGAKLGSLKSGVRVVVSGKVGDQYRIRLGDDMEAWLPTDFAQLLPPETPYPKSLVGSLTISGNDKEDIVTVALDQRLPYLSQQTVNPTTIIVDIFGASSNTNWITHQLSGQGIQSVAWSQVAAEQYRLTITLKYAQHWGYDIAYDNGSTMRIVVRRPPVYTSTDSVLNRMTIAVDAGHGGDNDGAIGSTGVMEKDITLSIAKHLDSLLILKGVNVVMTRTADETVSMVERTDKILNSGAQILVSIHANSVGNSVDPELSKGTSAYYRHIGFQPLASAIYGKMLELKLDQFGIVGSFNFTLNALTQVPNVLVETAFMSNPEDEILLLDDHFREKIAEQIMRGLEEFVSSNGDKKK